MQIEKAGGLPKEGVLVNGDSGNDVELFAVPGVRGCMVSNAHPELREWCNAHASANIFQASASYVIGIASCARTAAISKLCFYPRRTSDPVAGGTGAPPVSAWSSCYGGATRRGL